MPEESLASRLSVDQYFRWVQQQPKAERDLFELLEGSVRLLSRDTAQMQRLRLLQWQLQRFLKAELVERLLVPSATDCKPSATDCRFEVQMGPAVQLSESSCLKPAIVVRSSGTEAMSSQPLLNSEIVWVIDIVESCVSASSEARAQLYAQSGISDYWSLELNSTELRLYQRPSASGYQSHRRLQVGDRAAPNGVPLIVTLQEPVPLYFVTRTLKGQQTYKSSALPFSFAYRYDLSSTRIRTESP
ncbi:MAG: hypothetical protein WA947_23175 [Phormidesmis sp.]